MWWRGSRQDEGLKETEGGLSGEDARAGFDDGNGAQSGGAAAGCDGCGKVEVGTGGSGLVEGEERAAG